MVEERKYLEPNRQQSISLFIYHNQKFLFDASFKVKAAFTRAYNKSGALLPYSIASGAAKKNSVARSQTQASFDEEEENESDNDDDDINKDAMIKVCCLQD